MEVDIPMWYDIETGSYTPVTECEQVEQQPVTPATQVNNMDLYIFQTNYGDDYNNQIWNTASSLELSLHNVLQILQANEIH